MLSHLKTGLLILLIFGSLFQSYNLSFSNPKPENFIVGEYIQPQLIGKQVEVKELVFPDRIVLHGGNDLHSVLYPSTINYKLALNLISSKSLSNLFQFSSIDNDQTTYEKIKKENKGVELLFNQGVPFNLLSSIVKIQDKNMNINEIIDRIGIFYTDEQETIKTYFISDYTNFVYEVSDHDITSYDIEKLIAYIDLENAYEYVQEDLLIPSKPLLTESYQFTYSELTVEQLRGIFFVNPGVTRNIKERDGSEIFTDGNRGLQINNVEKRFIFTNPIASVKNNQSIKDELLTSVKFINDHGGLESTYRFTYKRQEQSLSNLKFNFQMYYKTFPVVDSSKQKIGTIDLNVQNGVMTNYDRSILLIQPTIIEKNDAVLISASEIKELIEFNSKSSYIQDIYPVYKVRVVNNTIFYIPVWAIELRDGSVEFL